jgi:aspartyl-tRNA(Asn)/glutamyl-tRNA(Gln) amidotransferase subunit C
MSLTPADVQKIAHLARLSINNAEIQPLTKDLDNILSLVDKMSTVKIQEVSPLAHPLQATQPLRDDLVTETNQRDLFLRNAPQSMMGLYLVPQVLETEEE